MKTKLSAVAAIVATVFGVMAGGAPAHATASVYAPNTGANFSTMTVYGNKSNFSIDSAGTMTATFTLAQPANIYSSLDASLTVRASENSYFADGVAHTYAQSMSLRDSTGKYYTVSNGGNMSAYTGTARNWVYSTQTYNQQSSSYVNSMTFDPTATDIELHTPTYVNYSGDLTMPAGTYTFTFQLLRDGAVIPASKFGANAADNRLIYSMAVPNQTTFTAPGTQQSINAYVYTCLDTAHIAVGDSLSTHPTLDGADVSNFAGSASWSWISSGNTAQSSYQNTITATADLIANPKKVSYTGWQIDSTPGSTASHTVALSVYNHTQNIEVSTACTVPTPSAAATITASAFSGISINLGILGSSNWWPRVYLEARDSQNNVVATGTANGSSTATQTSMPASSFTNGQTYTLRYRLMDDFYYGGPVSSWSPSASFTMPTITAPTLTASNGNLNVSVSPAPSGGAFYALVYLASDTNTQVSYGYLSGTSVTISNGLTFGNSYVAKYCQGMYSNGSVTCTGVSSPFSSAVTLTAPNYGFTNNPAISGGNAIGDANSLTSNIPFASNSFVTGSDGANGKLVAELSGSTVTVKRITPLGADSAFGGSGTVTFTATGITTLRGITFSGSGNKWVLTYAMSAGTGYVSGSFSSQTTTTYTQSLSNAPTVCNSSGGYSGVTGAGWSSSPIPNAQGDLYALVTCYVPVTYADNSTANVNAPTLVKLTGNDSATIVTKLNPGTAAENLANSVDMTVMSITPTYSFNPSATGSQPTLVFAIGSGAKPSSNGMAPSLTLKLLALKADGTAGYIGNGTSLAVSGGFSTQSFSLAPVNDGTTLYSVQQSGNMAPVYSVSAFNLSNGAMTDKVISEDAVTGISPTMSNYVMIGGMAPQVSGGNMVIYRVYQTGPTVLKLAPAVFNTGSGALTTREMVSLTSTASNPTYNWYVPSLDSTGTPTVLYAKSMTAAASLYWRTTAGGSAPQPPAQLSNVATAILNVNGSTIGNGSTVNLANGTTSVAVTVTPTESHATYVVTGNTGLTTGNNSVSVVVTAQDGTTQQVYTFTAAVAASNVATATITVDGTAVADGGSIAVANATTSVTIVVTRTESHATVGTVTGGTNLAVGDNAVSFTVTAQNGTTTRTYSITVVRLPSDATACLVGTYSTHGGYSSVTQSWSCVDAPAGSYVSTAGASAATLCAPGYFSASVASTSCTPASLNHFVANAGATAEVACPSNTHANATGAAACDPDRVLSSNKNVTITIGGKRATPGTVVNIVGIPAGRLNVNVSQDDIAARAYLSIPSNPVIGDNIVTVIVQAEDGSRTEQEITVRITEPVVTPPVVTPPVVTPPVVTPPVVTPPVVTPPVVTPPVKSSDATAVITVAGITVADGDHVNLPFGTASVPVVVTPNESHATYAVTGATGLQTGTSVLTVTVTAEDGTVKAYSYQLVVAADMSPVNLGTASASVLQQVTAALDAGRVAFFNVTAKGAAAATKVLAQIRAFKTELRAAGSTSKVSFAIKVTGASAAASVKVTP